jgi:hypothetical protein
MPDTSGLTGLCRYAACRARVALDGSFKLRAHKTGGVYTNPICKGSGQEPEMGSIR